MEGVHESVNDHTRRIRGLEEDARIYREAHHKLQARIKELETIVGVLTERIINLEETSEHYSQRLHQLEESERQRAKDEHERDVS